MKALCLGVVGWVGLLGGTLSAQEESSEETSGSLGNNNWAAVYDAYAKAWNTEEGGSYAAKHLNRYDLVLFGKTYSKVAGHSVSVTKTGWGEPELNWSVELGMNQIALTGAYDQTFTLIEFTSQIWLGPVPVVFKAGTALTVSCDGELVVDDVIKADARGAASIGVILTVAAGFKFGYIGIEGALNLVEAELTLASTLQTNSFTATSNFALKTSGQVSLVGKIGPFKKTIPIWVPPAQTWFDIPLLDVTLN